MTLSIGKVGKSRPRRLCVCCHTVLGLFGAVASEFDAVDASMFETYVHVDMGAYRYMCVYIYVGWGISPLHFFTFETHTI